MTWDDLAPLVLLLIIVLWWGALVAYGRVKRREQDIARLVAAAQATTGAQEPCTGRSCPLRCEDTQSYCEGCDDLVPQVQMDFTVTGHYRCLMCRGIELTPMVLQGVARGIHKVPARSTLDKIVNRITEKLTATDAVSGPLGAAERNMIQKVAEELARPQVSRSPFANPQVIASPADPLRIRGSLDFSRYQPPDTIPGLVFHIDELVHQTIRGLWGIPGPMAGSHVDAGQSLPWGSADARSGPDWEPDPDKNPQGARALSLCRAIEEMPPGERHKMVEALDKHLMEWPQDAEVVAKLIDPRLLQDDEQGWGDMPKS